MNTIIKKCLVTFVMLLGFSSFGQKSDSENILNHSVSVSSFDFRSKDLVGSSYLNEQFLPATVSNSNTNYFIRHNTFQDEMEFEKDGKSYHLVKSFDYTISFIGINKVYQVYSYVVDDQTKEGFFVVLHKGEKVTLLLKERIKLFEEVEAKTGYDKYKPPTLKRIKDKIYIGYKNNTTKELPKKKKDILKLFSDDAKEIESYAKKNKLGFKKNEDLIKIFKYYNTLK